MLATSATSAASLWSIGQFIISDSHVSHEGDGLPGCGRAIGASGSPVGAAGITGRAALWLCGGMSMLPCWVFLEIDAGSHWSGLVWWHLRLGRLGMCSFCGTRKTSRLVVCGARHVCFGSAEVGDVNALLGETGHERMKTTGREEMHIHM